MNTDPASAHAHNHMPRLERGCKQEEPLRCGTPCVSAPSFQGSVRRRQVPLSGPRQDKRGSRPHTIRVFSLRPHDSGRTNAGPTRLRATACTRRTTNYNDEIRGQMDRPTVMCSDPDNPQEHGSGFAPVLARECEASQACVAERTTMSPVLRLRGRRIGQQAQETRRECTGDGDGEELSLEVPDNGWPALRECVRA